VNKSDDGISPRAALELVRRLEQHDLAPDNPHAALMLEEARQLLQAEWLSVRIENGKKKGRDGDASALWAHAGPLPDDDDQERLRDLSTGAKTAPLIRLGRDVFLVARAAGGDRALAARRVRGLPTPAPWQLDFFEFLAERALGAMPHASSAGQPKGREAAELQLPRGFIVGPSPAMAHLLRYLRSTIRSPLDVLLLGETGTGKELLARLVHESGPSGSGPFVAINCAAIPSELLEAELFGVEARVATGVDARPGLFVRADRGTLFLDEIGDMSEPMQAKLLRALQEREVLPLGGQRPRRIDVRVISASNKNLPALVADGRFRSDLFFRLRGLQFHLPPLRERREDLLALVTAFVEDACRKYEKRVRGVSRKTLDLLLRHEWPGNVRELRNEVERAVLIAEDDASLEPRHFGTIHWQVEHEQSRRAAVGLDGEPNAAGESASPAGGTLAERVAAVERQAIRDALAAARGNKSRAARALGITRNGLALKMKRLGLE